MAANAWSIAMVGESALNAFAAVIFAFLVDAFVWRQAPRLCITAGPHSWTALTVACIVLTASHRLTWPMAAGRVRGTAQTLALCINGLVFAPAVSLAACALYITLGLVAALRATWLAPHGPNWANPSARAYIAGFWPAAAGLAFAKASTRLDSLSASAAACAAAHLVILSFGTAGLARRSAMAPRAALAAGMVPFVPGALLKSGLAALLASAAAPVWNALEASCRRASAEDCGGRVVELPHIYT